MPSWVTGSLVIVTGVVAALSGVVVIQSRLAKVQRTTARSAILADDWSAWFVGGFSQMTVGARGLLAVAVGLAWVLAGVGLIGLGVQGLARR